ncbi:ABC transporter substrate-binding protein [uncultured Photobacterium sp.]|uniref:ABC transporter substrate-binding protein n=1 Tax=uncultured Photobacterium sp. TaxID=173973 RepID=UPI0026031572|nr:ABC transporter substrate-binding protein [uncultured Photobacterium sp.]
MTDNTNNKRQPEPTISRRQILRTTGLLGISGTLSALAPGILRAQGLGSPLKIGACGPFTGPAEHTGNAIKQGILMALEDARKTGEIPIAIDGNLRDIEIVWVDSESNPTAAIRAASHAITHKGVKLMIGGWHSSVALALMDTEANLNTIHIGHLGASQYIANKINLNPERYRGWFKGWPSPPKLAGLYGQPLRYFIEQGLWRPANYRAAILVENSAYGHGWGEALSASLKEVGFDPYPYEVTDLDETEFTPMLKKFKQRKVSLVAMTSSGDVAVSNFVRQFQQQGITALLLGHGIRWLHNWHKMTGDASDFVVAMDSAMPIALWQQWWVRRFQARYNQEPSIQAAGLHYDYTRMAIRALNTASTLDFDTLTATLHQISHKGIWNLYRFSTAPGPHALSANEVMTGRFMKGFYHPMVQLFGGEAKIIWPLKYAEQRFRQPPWLTDKNKQLGSGIIG